MALNFICHPEPTVKNSFNLCLYFWGYIRLHSRICKRNRYAIVKKALLLVEGNYVIMITSPDVEAMTAKVNGAFGK